MNPDEKDSAIHNPELPGVRTFKKDTAGETDGFSFGGIKLTVPEKGIEGGAHTPQSGGRIGGDKELFDVERAFNNELVQEGTFVSDRKKKRISIGALLKSAVTEWWGNTQKSMETTVDKFEFLKPKEEQKMEAPEARTSVIQEAAKLARQAPRDDHALVVEKVRTFAHDAEVITGKPFTIKEPDVKVGAHWVKNEELKEAKAPVKEDTKPLTTIDLRTSAIAPTIGKHATTPLTAYAPKTIAPQTPKVSVPTPVLTVKPQIASMRTPEKMSGETSAQPKKEIVWTHFGGEKKPTVDLREKTGAPARPGASVPHVEAPSVPRATRFTTEAVPTPERQPVAVTPVAFETERTAKATPYKPVIETRKFEAERSEPFNLLKVLTHLPRTLIIATIVVVGGGLGVLTAILVVQNAKDAPEEIAEGPIVIPSFLNTDEQVAFSLPSNRGETYATLIELGKKKSVATSQFYPTVNEGGREVPASSEHIMKALAWNAPGTFTRGLGTHTVLGSVGEPYLILQSTNFDVAFAGMLTWERNMSEDLAPLFGTPLINVGFTDALTSNRTIRILKDGDGKERIVYGFVNKNLIVITTSTEALSKVIEHIK